MKALRKVLRYPPVGVAIVSLVTLGGILLVRSGGLGKRGEPVHVQFQRPELIVYDLFVRRRARRQARPADPHVIICGMSEDDLVKYGHPLDDAKLSTLLENLAAAGPCVMGLDIYRDLPEPRTGESYPRLEATLRKLKNLVAIERIRSTRIKPPPALEDDPERVTPNNLPNDSQFDGVCRRADLYFVGGLAEPRKSFAFALASTYLEAHNVTAEPVDSPDGGDSVLMLGSVAVPPVTPNAGAYSGLDLPDYTMLLDFRGPQDFRTITFGEVLENRVPAGLLKDAIVVIGVKTPSVKDSISTPIADRFRGAVFHATVIDQILRSALKGESPPRWWPDWAEIAWIGLCTLVGGALSLVFRSPWKLAPALAALLGAIGFAGWTAMLHSLWIPITTPAFGAVVAATFGTSLALFLEYSERRVMRSLFSRHVSEEVLAVLWAERDQLLEGGRLKPQRVIATVLFTDLKDYSTIAEEMDPTDLMNWVNEYMSCIAPQVEAHGGIVNSYGGDALMAVFGAPVPHTREEDIDEDAIRAVECALAMRRELKTLNADWTARKLPTVSMRVGIYTGPVVTGSIGSSQRLEYTALGDTTNIAARLQSLGKELPPDEATDPCTILIGDPTWQRLHGRFSATLVGPRRLKGRAKEVLIHSILCATSTTSTL